MRAVVLESAYGIDNLKVIEKPDPTPGPGQIVVDIKAATLNYRDLATVTAPSGRTPFVPCSDGAGVVSAIGDGVTRVKVGDHVAPLFFQGWFAGDPTPQGLGGAYTTARKLLGKKKIESILAVAPEGTRELVRKEDLAKLLPKLKQNDKPAPDYEKEEERRREERDVT